MRKLAKLSRDAAAADGDLDSSFGIQNRRAAIGALLLVFGGVCGFSGFALGGGFESRYSQKSDLDLQDQGFLAMKQFIFDRYGLDVQFLILPTRGADFNRKLTTLNKLMAAVVEGLSQYPPGIFLKNGLKKIVIEDSPTVKDKAVLGYFDEEDSAIAIALDVADQMSVCDTLNHEICHALDVGFDGTEADDIDWAQVHASVTDSPYLNIHGVDEYDGDLTPNPDCWYVRPYGQRNPEEDRATFGACLMNRAKHLILLTKMKAITDPESRRILLGKYILTRVAYEKWSGGLINAQYWDDLLAGTVDDRYWDERLGVEKAVPV